MTITVQKKNHLQEQPSLYWIFNPFYLFFAQLNTGYSPDGFLTNWTITELSVLNKIELDRNFPSEYLDKQNKIFNHFFHQEDLNFFEMLCKDTGFSVLTMTFVLSFYIAGDSEFRDLFYQYYDGRIPCITQFLLNHIRIGPLDEKNYVSTTIISPDYNYLYTMGAELIKPLHPGLITEDFEEVFIDWFKQVELLFANDKLPFFHFVQLEKTPLEATEKLTLTAFNQTHSSFLTNSNVENSPLKEKFMVLNKAIDANLMSAAEFDLNLYDSKERIMQGPLEKNDGNYEKSLEKIAKNYNVKELGSQLIDLIINCHPNDLL